MTIGGRLKFVIGIVIVFALAAGGFLYLNYSMSNITSRAATLEADSYAISVEYGGIIEKQYVDIGTEVKKNDPLFEINSSSLKDALDSKRATKSGLLFSLTPDGNILLRSNNNGVIRQVNYPEGAYLPSNTQIAQLAVKDSDYVTAKFLLRAPDYSRIDKKKPLHVTLPDNTQLEAKIFDITLQQEGENVYTIVKARFSRGATINSNFSPGTPVSANWQLQSNSWYTNMLNLLKQLIKPTTES
ncbi:Biotin/lipoyl attachment protein [Candidatus Saccharibacteria bacterium RAAC3_TM7_1]|nr:Biotin/lipoyl attachment protein [Candidatus Saccharibacteria bacterium RAAC3_TM7_1]HCZ28363.1 hypothetical protein [Candidatus Saccharibacteria bacterium]